MLKVDQLISMRTTAACISTDRYGCETHTYRRRSFRCVTTSLISLSSSRLNPCARSIPWVVLSTVLVIFLGHRFHFKHNHLHPRSSSCRHQAKRQQFNFHRRIPTRVGRRTSFCSLLKIESFYYSTMSIDQYEWFCCQQFSSDHTISIDDDNN